MDGYLVLKVEFWVQLDQLPGTETVFVDADQQREIVVRSPGTLPLNRPRHEGQLVAENKRKYRIQTNRVLNSELIKK